MSIIGGEGRSIERRLALECNNAAKSRAPDSPRHHMLRSKKSEIVIAEGSGQTVMEYQHQGC